MYSSREWQEEMRQQGENYQKQKEEEMKGKKYKTENGVEISCLQCNNPYFHKGKALLNTRGMTFFGLDWLDGGAVILICTGCGFIHWFHRDTREV